MSILTKNRLQEMKKTVSNSWTETQREARIEILNRIKEYIMKADNDNELYSYLYNDFPAWCPTFLDDDGNDPLFPAPWQQELIEKINNAKYVMALNTRKCGKSTILAAKMAHVLCGSERQRISGFAPTHGQDFVYRKAREYLNRSKYLSDKFIKRDTTEKIVAHNGSKLINRSISITTGGSSIRGEYGNVVYVDEVQEVDQHIMDTVVLPIIADAYSDKKLIIIGTPNLYKNPYIQKRWKDWKKKADNGDEYDYMTVDWKRAVEEGCMKKEWILDQREMMTKTDFIMEYEARFPDTSLRFFPKSLLNRLVQGAFVFYHEPKEDMRYAMAVDWAKYQDKTEILVGEYHPEYDKMLYCYWKEIDPKDKITDYEEQVDIVKDIFFQFGCEWICPDTTSNQDVLGELLFSETEYPSISKSMMYTPEDKKDISKIKKWGYKASLHSNWEMWQNHKQQMTKERLIVPRNGPKEDRFYNKYVEQHNHLKAKSARGGSVIRLEAQTGEYKDLAVTAAMLSLYMIDAKKTPASFYLEAL